jgi:uncharacterized protein (DUF2252 family)
MSTTQQLSQPQPNLKYRLHPTQLNVEARAQHVVKALLAYNKGIIKNNPTGANAKFEKLNQSPFVFLRGTADLMYRDLLGTDADKSIVLCMGDVHLENYGVMEAEDGSLIWSLNDFDEAAFAPFSWDVKRGATSTALAAKENGFSDKRCFKLAQSFAEAYFDAIRQGLDQIEAQPGFTRTQAPKLIKKLIKKAEKVDPAEWLEQEYLDSKADRPQFKETDEIQPLPKEIVTSIAAELQTALEDYLASLSNLHKTPPAKIKVLDVATKTGSGTGSIGLWRYYALVKATRANNTEMVILEIKQERCSVLSPYVGEGPLLFPSEGSRVAFAENIQLPNANPYYGYTNLAGISYLVRERSPHKRRVKLEKLNKYKDFKIYAQACGTALAYAHLRSNWVINSNGQSATQRILQSVNPDTFVVDMGRFAANMADRVTRDWQSFKQAFQAGKFTF